VPGSDKIAGLGFERVVRDAPVSIVVVDASGRVLYSNGRARELTSRQLGSQCVGGRAQRRAVDCEIELDVRPGLPAGPLGATGIEVLRILGEALTNA